MTLWHYANGKPAPLPSFLLELPSLLASLAAVRVVHWLAKFHLASTSVCGGQLHLLTGWLCLETAWPGGQQGEKGGADTGAKVDPWDRSAS